MDIETHCLVQCCLKLKSLLPQSLKCIPDFLLFIISNGEEQESSFCYIIFPSGKTDNLVSFDVYNV